MITNIALLFFGVSTLLFLSKIFRVRNLATKFVGVNSVTSIVCVIIVIISIFYDEKSYINIAILYSLVSFISNVVIMKILRK